MEGFWLYLKKMLNDKKCKCNIFIAQVPKCTHALLVPSAFRDTGVTIVKDTCSFIVIFLFIHACLFIQTHRHHRSRLRPLLRPWVWGPFQIHPPHTTRRQ